MNVQVSRGKQKRGWEAAEEKVLMKKECLADEAMSAKNTKDANAKSKPKTKMQKGATKFGAWAERVYPPPPQLGYWCKARIREAQTVNSPHSTMHSLGSGKGRGEGAPGQ
jgi:hypothetical protein